MGDREKVMIEGIPIEVFSKLETDTIFGDSTVMDIIRKVKDYCLNKKLSLNAKEKGNA